MSSATATRVVKGEGILHAHKVQYSKETHQLLKALLEESKLSFLQQQQIQNSLRNGDSLPPLSSGRSIKSGVRASTCNAIKKPIYHNKRPKDAIIRSGAYERAPFVPTHPRVDKGKEKQKLQSIMAFGKVIPLIPVHKMHLAPKVPQKTTKQIDRFTELVEEVQDRLEFLLEMKELGYEKKYRPIIEQQVAAKVREMKAINPQHCQDLGTLNHFLPAQSKPQA